MAKKRQRMAEGHRRMIFGRRTMGWTLAEQVIVRKGKTAEGETRMNTHEMFPEPIMEVAPVQARGTKRIEATKLHVSAFTRARRVEAYWLIKTDYNKNFTRPGAGFHGRYPGDTLLGWLWAHGPSDARRSKIPHTELRTQLCH